MDLREYLLLLKKTGYTVVSIDGLLSTVYPVDPNNTPDLPGTEQAPEPVPRAPGVYPDYESAKKAAKKDEAPIYDNRAGGYINIKK